MYKDMTHGRNYIYWRAYLEAKKGGEGHVEVGNRISLVVGAYMTTTQAHQLTIDKVQYVPMGNLGGRQRPGDFSEVQIYL